MATIEDARTEAERWLDEHWDPELVTRLLVLVGPLYMIDVMCDAEVTPFYERLGFSRGNGVVRRNYTWRSNPES